jgi:ADP-ribose pyrophosphatase YjhB (NUDIX family)
MPIKKLSREDYKHIYSRVPRSCAELVIKTEKGILFTKRSFGPWKGQWHIPGGTILYGESLKEAVKRVAKEELNLKVKIIKNIGKIEYLKNLKEKKHVISLIFLVKIVSGKIKLDNQATDYIFSKKIPPNTIKEQREFFQSIIKGIL